MLIAITTATGWGRELVRGIGRYQAEYQRFEIYYRTLMQLPKPEMLLSHSDGVLSFPYSDPWVKLLREGGNPVILLGAAIEGFYSVNVDELAVGRMAFEHLAGLGLKQFGFIGDVGKIATARYRWEGFQQAAMARGVKPILAPASVDRDFYGAPGGDLYRWIRQLPRPIGLFAWNTDTARRANDACRRAKIVVPEDVAVIGVDRDEIECQLTTPTLTTIDHAYDEVGYMAAGMLDRLLRGHTVDHNRLLIQPRGIVPGDSTRRLYVNCAEVAQALDFIRAHATEGINVSDVLDVVPVARRKLERAFRRTVNRTIYGEIMRIRVERACTLLRGTNIRLNEVAELSGFSSAIRLHEAFRRAYQITPNQYRRRVQNPQRSSPKHISEVVKPVADVPHDFMSDE